MIGQQIKDRANGQGGAMALPRAPRSISNEVKTTGRALSAGGRT